MSRFSEKFHLLPLVAVALMTLSLPGVLQADCVDYSGFLHSEGLIPLPNGIRAGAVSGNRAYVAGTSGFQVVDITNPQFPSVVGQVGLPGYGDGVTLAGSYAYVTDRVGGGGFEIIDISDETAPAIVGHLGSSAIRAAVSGTHAYLAVNLTGLQVVDVSNPASPTVVGSLVLSEAALAVAVSGSQAFVLGSSTFYVVDVSDPTMPQVAGSVTTAQAPKDLAVSGSYVYVSEASAGVQVIDVSTPSSPSVVGSWGGPADVVAVSGSRAYTNSSSYYYGGTLRVIDISDPTSPQVVGNSTGRAGTLNAMFVADARLYGVHQDLAGLQVIDISNNAPLPLVGNVDTRARPRTLRSSGPTRTSRTVPTGSRWWISRMRCHRSSSAPPIPPATPDWSRSTDPMLTSSTADPRSG